MASIVKRGKGFCVVYYYIDHKGIKKQKWESYKSLPEARKRQREVEYGQELSTLVVPTCSTLNDLLKEYVEIYGRNKWALSTYEANVSLIRNYIEPTLGKKKLREINARLLERYYNGLLYTPAVPNPYHRRTPEKKFVTSSTIRDIHKLLKCCFRQAVKWEMIEKNPADHATVPRYEPKERDIWTSEILMKAMDLCEDDTLKIAMNLAFACSLRMGELLGLTWDCVDISEDAIEGNRAFLFISKELQRVTKEAMKKLDEKDVIFIFPEESRRNKTVRVLKKPKTRSSIRKVYIPRSVAHMLIEWKDKQNELKEILGEEYQDYNLVMTTSFGMPVGRERIQKSLNKLIEENNLPKIVFHSLRHTSVTYKLKMTGGDIKAVQGDSGHSQVNMVTNVYSHIIDEDRKKNAAIMEETFYKKRNANPDMDKQSRSNKGKNVIEIPEGWDTEMVRKVLETPEMMALLSALAKGTG
ncbi:MAG: site-specific integrase [Eubacterium sp.]|nr:site-specific integrase [Eubacterium sp.]